MQECQVLGLVLSTLFHLQNWHALAESCLHLLSSDSHILEIYAGQVVQFLSTFLHLLGIDFSINERKNDLVQFCSCVWMMQSPQEQGTILQLVGHILAGDSINERKNVIYVLNSLIQKGTSVTSFYVNFL
ncbi:hypothetical protein ACJX0J_031616, partial [Zea mays]